MVWPKNCEVKYCDYYTFTTISLNHNIYLGFINDFIIAFIKRCTVPPRFVYCYQQSVLEMCSKAKIYHIWQFGPGHVAWLCYRTVRIHLFVKLCHTNWLSNCAWQCVKPIKFQRLRFVTYSQNLLMGIYYYHNLVLCCCSHHTGTWSSYGQWEPFFPYWTVTKYMNTTCI